MKQLQFYGTLGRLLLSISMIVSLTYFLLVSFQEHNSRPYSSKSSSHRCIGSLCPRLCSSKHFSPHSSSSFSHQATHRRRLEIQSRPEKGNNKYFPELFAIEIHWSTTTVENNFSNCELSRFSATNQHNTWRKSKTEIWLRKSWDPDLRWARFGGLKKRFFLQKTLTYLLKIDLAKLNLGWVK